MSNQWIDNTLFKIWDYSITFSIYNFHLYIKYDVFLIYWLDKLSTKIGQVIWVHNTGGEEGAYDWHYLRVVGKVLVSLIKCVTFELQGN